MSAVHWTKTDDGWVSDASSLAGDPITCPCGRTKFRYAQMFAHKNQENELTHWTYVGGCSCGKLTIFND